MAGRAYSLASASTCCNFSELKEDDFKSVNDHRAGAKPKSICGTTEILTDCLCKDTCWK